MLEPACGAGYFPIKLQSLPEGSCVHAHCPVFQITTEGPYAPLCTFLEVLLTFVWCAAGLQQTLPEWRRAPLCMCAAQTTAWAGHRYPTTVATLSRRTKDAIEAAFERSVDAGRGSPLVGSRLHDFGFRGCSGLEQSAPLGCMRAGALCQRCGSCTRACLWLPGAAPASVVHPGPVAAAAHLHRSSPAEPACAGVLGGVAHLLNFDGSDTLSACYYAQVHACLLHTPGRALCTPPGRGRPLQGVMALLLRFLAAAARGQVMQQSCPAAALTAVRACSLS